MDGVPHRMPIQIRIPTPPSTRPEDGNPTPGSHPSEGDTLSLHSPAGAEVDATTGIHTPAAPHIERAFDLVVAHVVFYPVQGLAPKRFSVTHRLRARTRFFLTGHA